MQSLESIHRLRWITTEMVESFKRYFETSYSQRWFKAIRPQPARVKGDLPADVRIRIQELSNAKLLILPVLPIIVEWSDSKDLLINASLFRDEHTKSSLLSPYSLLLSTGEHELFEPARPIFMNNQNSSTTKRSESRPRKRLHCFNCNRNEGHYLALKSRWFYSYLLGLTFGLISFIGPFRCQCCGEKRLLATNRFHPRTWLNSPSFQKIFKKKLRWNSIGLTSQLLQPAWLHRLAQRSETSSNRLFDPNSDIVPLNFSKFGGHFLQRISNGRELAFSLRKTRLYFFC